jgi:anthranilate synthase component 1
LPGTLTASRPLEADPADFLAAVARVRGHIAAGDVYQANISRRWEGRTAHGVAPWMLYERLRLANPAPFSGLALLGDLAVVSSSPERLLRIRDGRAETRPIAGTRRRHDPRAPEHARRLGLVDNPKERAEHVMLIDLERNDLGRVCEAGSVAVDEFMVVESYAHVHHIVSNVSGRLRPGATPGAVLRAIFPGGTITGCPKVRCMEIVQEVEGCPRSAYTGAMGYMNRDGSCDFNILIRTMCLAGDRLWLNAGSGIVADSVPERELDETRAKAQGMLLALDG